jgi:polyisoprenoid-binding protein YceI
MIRSSALLLSVLLMAAPVAAQAPAAGPAANAARVAAGTYKVDPDHTQVVWSLDHLGFSPLYGMFGQITGTLQLDPARLQNARLNIEIPMSGLSVTSPGFAKHLATPDLFDSAKFPTARFVSTSVRPQGNRAVVTGNLTLHGVTRPVTLQAAFYGAGPNPRTQAQTVGFTATTTIKRSQWGLGYGVPAVGDDTELRITAAFEKQG